MSLYAITQITENTPRTSRERLQLSTSDVLVCASINKHLVEKEYVFDGKHMEDIKYVSCVLNNGLRNQLDQSAINLSPIKRAFQKKATEQKN